MIAFQNEMVIRYLEKVVVQDDGYEVEFKGGILTKVHLISD